jgi:hypothetical protein
MHWDNFNYLSYRVVFFVPLLDYHTDFTLILKHSIQQPLREYVVCVEKERGIGNCQHCHLSASESRFLLQCTSVQCYQLCIPFWNGEVH